MAKIPEFKPNFNIPTTTGDAQMPNVTSVMDMSTWATTMGNMQTPMMPVWPQQGYYDYQPIMTVAYAPSTPTVIAAPPALNINGMKRKYEKEVISELHDPALPKELTAMFQPLFCKLCQMHLNSSSNAKLHYQSKNHLKKIRKYLVEYAEKTGEPLHKMAKVTSKTQIESQTMYCTTCDLQLTSKLHAEQHYMGKNHNKAVSKVRAPAGSGYYDESGIWHRLEKPKVDTTGRFTIGMSFVKAEDPKAASPATPKSKYYCDLCKVSTTSSEHLMMHISGQKHQKNMKKNNAQPSSAPKDPFGDLDATPIIGPQIPKDNILTSVMKNNVTEQRDYSVYRTPSGQYYCHPCDVTLNSESQFMQHLESKKHLKKKSGQK